MPAPVHLNVYDLSTSTVIHNANRLLRLVGTGAFHVSVEIYGTEWSYGSGEPGPECEPLYLHDGTGSGINGCEPHSCQLHSFAETVPMGETLLTEMEVKELLNALASDWM